MSRIQAEDLATVRPIGPANWSPDGGSLAYVQAERSGTNRLWLVSKDGGASRIVADASVVVEGTDGTDRRDVGGGPQWSPDGRSLAFLSAIDGRQIGVCVADVGSGKIRTVTAGADRTPRWSPDGRLAFVRHRDGRDDVYTIDAPGEMPVQLTYGHYDNNDIAWSPDGRWIAFSSQRSDEDVFSSSLCVVPARGGAVVRLTHDDRANDRAPRWSPDGRTIAFVSNRDDSDDIWTIPPLGGQPTRITSGRGDKGDPRWSPDGTQIAYTHVSQTNIEIAVMAPGSEHATVVTDGGVNTAPRWSPDGTQLAFVHSSAAEPKNVWLMAPRGDGRKPLTSSNVRSGQSIEWSRPELIVLRPEDGVEVEALLYPAVPASGHPGPAVVFVHEGPNNIQTNGFEGLIQFLAQRGYTIVAPNFRGSTGYGRTFMEANAGDRVGADLRDWAAAARHLAGLRTVDPKRIAILGHSAGGEATLLSLGLLPDVFAAGVAMSAPSNRFTYWEDTSMAWARRLRYKLMGLPSAAREKYIQRSAVTHIAAYRSPVLIIQGEDDPGVPASQAREMAAALKAAGKRHECVIYPGEGHYFAGADAIIDTADRIEGFLAKELGARAD